MTAITHDQITDKIKSSALLVALHLGRYNPVKTDKLESIKVRLDHNIRSDDNILSVKKNTLPTADVLEKIEKLDNKLRSTFDGFCAPYARGIGLLPATKFLELRAALNPLLDERNVLIKHLANDYGIYLDGAKRLLNGAFKDSDYPAVSDVIARFHHKLDVFPIADPRDTKLNVLGEIAESINEAVVDTFREKAESVTPYIREVLLDPLTKFSETLQNPEATFKDSLVENVREAADRAETLNILDDDEIVNAVYEIRQRLTVNPDRLREDKVYRALAVSDAAPIIESLGGTIPSPKVVAPRKPRGKKTTSSTCLPPEAIAAVQPCTPAPQRQGITAHELVEGIFSCTEINQEEPTTPVEDTDQNPYNTPAAAILAKLGW